MWMSIALSPPGRVSVVIRGSGLRRGSRVVVVGRGSVVAPALAGRKDAKLVAVLRDRPPGDHQPGRAQHVGDLLVGQRALSIFLGDEPRDLLLHGLGRDVFARVGAD